MRIYECFATTAGQNNYLDNFIFSTLQYFSLLLNATSITMLSQRAIKREIQGGHCSENKSDRKKEIEKKQKEREIML